MADKTTPPKAPPPNAAPSPAPSPAGDGTLVRLPRPIDVDGMGRITELRLRPPVARDLYGVSLVDLGTSQIGALMALGARIHMPRLPPDAWDGLSLPNTMAVTGAVAGFFADVAQDLGLDLGLEMPGQAAQPSPSNTSNT